MDGLSRQAIGTMPSDRKRHVTQVFRDISARLRRYVRQRVPSEFETDDILQEVWQQFIRVVDVQPIEQVTAWLYTVARHRIIDRRRKRTPTSLEALGADEEDGELSFDRWLPIDLRTPATEHQRHQFWDRLHAALSELPAEQRQVFVWHELDGLSYQEMAEITGDNLNTLLSRKRYAVRHLRRHLQDLRDEMIPNSKPPRP